MGFKWPPLATEALWLYSLPWAWEGCPESLQVVPQEWKSQLPASAPVPSLGEHSVGCSPHSGIRGLPQPPVRNLNSEPGGCWLAGYI